MSKSKDAIIVKPRAHGAVTSRGSGESFRIYLEQTTIHAPVVVGDRLVRSWLEAHEAVALATSLLGLVPLSYWSGKPGEAERLRKYMAMIDTQM